MKKHLQFIFGVFCLCLAVLMALILSLPTLGSEQTFTFPSHYSAKEVTLEASYWPGSGNGWGVLICPGYSCDRQKWRPMADLLVSKGFAVMSFDYSGQGASQGVIGFDNAKTDAIPVEIDDAIGQFCLRSGLDRSHVILLGHSMGGRAILRLMDDWHNPDAMTTVTSQPVAAAILLSPEVNYEFSAQASLFAGTSDDTQEPWRSYSAANTQGMSVYLYGSTADDIVSDGDVLAIYTRLGGVDVPAAGVWSASQVNAYGSRITVGVTSGVLHSYQMYSPRFAAFMNQALDELVPGSPVYAPWKMLQVYGSWFLGLFGLFFILHALTAGKIAVTDEVPVLTDAAAFLRRKALMWLPGTIMAFVICCLCVCMPFGSPVMNIPYMCFIAGYGLVMLLAYRKGRFAGTSGKLPKCSLQLSGDRWAMGRCMMGCIVLCLAVWFILRATMYRLIPLNARLFWVLLAAVLMAVGYYVSGCERDMMDKAHVKPLIRFWYNVITYVPLFLLVLFYMAIKSYSGMIGQMQNMVLMYIFCIPLGDYLRRSTGSRLVGAVVSAFLFQTLMITSAALISMF